MEQRFAYYKGWTDCEPFEVIRVVRPGVVELRAMQAKQLHKMEELDPHPGGFCCHFANQRAQRWDIQPNPEARVITVRQSNAKAPQKNGRWFAPDGGEYRFCDKPYKFHDYNF